MKNLINKLKFTKSVICFILTLSLIISTLIISSMVSGAQTTVYTFDFEEASSGKYNSSSAWSYDKSANGFAGNKTSVLKYDPPGRNTYNTTFIMPEADNGKYLLNYDCVYEVSFKYYSEGIGSGVIEDFMIRDNTSLLAGVELEIDKTKGTNGEWKKASVTFQPKTDGTFLSFGLKVSGQYSKVCIYFDDFTVTAKEFEQGPADELFINTSDDVINFDGENKSFSSTGLKFVSGDKRYICGNSTTMLKFTAAAAGTDYGISFYNGLESVALNANKYYTIKFKYYNPSKNGKVSFTVGTSAENSAWTDYVIGDIVTLENETDGWVDGQTSFMISSKTENANYLFIRVKSDVVGNETYFDNFEVIQEKDMDADIVETDFEDTNATLTSAAWDWVDLSKSPISGNNGTVLKFEPGEKALTYYVTKLFKGKRTLPIDNGATYSLSFDYYVDAFEGELGEFYIKNKSGENLFKAFLDVTKENGTNGVWKNANFVFSALATEEDYLQIMCYTKADNTKIKIYYDNFKLVRINNLIANEKILEAENDSFNVSVLGGVDGFDGYADISLQFKLNFESVYGNQKVIDIADEKYLVSDYGLVYRPAMFNSLGELIYDQAAITENLISLGYHTETVNSGNGILQFVSKIINIRSLYKEMDIDARPFIVISPVNGTGTVYAYGKSVSVNVLDVAENSQDSAVKQFIS